MLAWYPLTTTNENHVEPCHSQFVRICKHAARWSAWRRGDTAPVPLLQCVFCLFLLFLSPGERCVLTLVKKANASKEKRKKKLLIRMIIYTKFMIFWKASGVFGDWSRDIYDLCIFVRSTSTNQPKSMKGSETSPTTITSSDLKRISTSNHVVSGTCCRVLTTRQKNLERSFSVTYSSPFRQHGIAVRDCYIIRYLRPPNVVIVLSLDSRCGSEQEPIRPAG